MRATQARLVDFMQGPKQFIIPIYQRTYSWDTAQCNQLWEDIVRIAQDDSVPGHFVGSVVYVEPGVSNASGMFQQWLVIDGQQRLTTITLLLQSLIDALMTTEDGAMTAEQIREGFLINRFGKGDLRYKLLLTQSDRETLTHLVDNKVLPDVFSRRIIANYDFFRNKIKESGFEPALLHQGIAKLMIVDVALDRSHDNPQLIFESLNSTGLELSQADLIRNYVLMGQSPEHMEELYKDHWFPMEQRFAATGDNWLFDRFMRDYLTIKTSRIPNIREVYKAFKEYANTKAAGSLPQLVADIARFSRYFVNIAGGREPDKALREAFDDINTLKVDVAYPFLLEMYDCYDAGRLSQSGFLTILRLVESYVFRRVICGIPTNTLNKTFAGLATRLDSNNLIESLQAVFLTMDSYRRFPSDEEFAREFAVKDVYNLRTRNYLLRKLENAQHKDRVIVEGYTIEHIMPQNPNLSSAWKTMLGPDWQTVQARWLHTIGNITLTLYNAPMSDRPFLEKRDMKGGLAQTPLALNDGLRTLETWNAEAIQQRGTSLAKVACTVWRAPVVSGAVLSKYSTLAIAAAATGSLDDFEPLAQEQWRELFEQFRARVLNLDSSVKEYIGKQYITYASDGPFATIVPQWSRLRLTLNIPFDQFYDPKGYAEDVTDMGYWNDDSALVPLKDSDELDDVLALVRQAFEYQRGEGSE